MMESAIKELFNEIVEDKESLKILNMLSEDISDAESLKRLLGVK